MALVKTIQELIQNFSDPGDLHKIIIIYDNDTYTSRITTEVSDEVFLSVQKTLQFIEESKNKVFGNNSGFWAYKSHTYPELATTPESVKVGYRLVNTEDPDPTLEATWEPFFPIPTNFNRVIRLKKKYLTFGSIQYDLIMAFNSSDFQIYLGQWNDGLYP